MNERVLRNREYLTGYAFSRSSYVWNDLPSAEMLMGHADGRGDHVAGKFPLAQFNAAPWADLDQDGLLMASFHIDQKYNPPSLGKTILSVYNALPAGYSSCTHATVYMWSRAKQHWIRQP